MYIKGIRPTRRAFLLLIVGPLLLIITGIWLLQIRPSILGLSSDPQNTEGDNVESGLVADSFMEAASVRLFDSQGQVSQRLTSHSIQLYQGQQELHFNSPSLEVTDFEAKQWTASSDLGKLDMASQTLFLQGNVSVVQIEDTYQNSFTTTELLFSTRNQIATTDKEVRFQQLGHRVTGTGLIADFAQGKYLILNDIKGVHYVD